MYFLQQEMYKMGLEYLVLPDSKEANKGDAGLCHKSAGSLRSALALSNIDDGTGFKYIKYV